MDVKVVVVAVTAAVWGCAKSATAPAVTPGATASCTATLSRLIAGSFDCRPAIIGWVSATDRSAFGFSVAAAASQPAIIVSISWPGEPAARAYTSSDSLAQGVAEVLVSPNIEWLVTVGGGNTPQGSYALTLTSVSDTVATARGKAYLVAGTLTATLPAVAATGASGAVSLTVTF